MASTAVLGFAAEFRDRASPKLKTLGQTYAQTARQARVLTSAIRKQRQAFADASMGFGIAAAGLGIIAHKLVGFWGRAADAATEYQKAQTVLGQVMNATKKEMEAASKFTKKVGLATLFSATQATEAYTALYQAGLGGASKAALTTTLDFATASAGTLELGETAAFAGALIKKASIDMSKQNRIINKQGIEVNELTRHYDMMLKMTKISGFAIRDYPMWLNSMRQALSKTKRPFEEILALSAVLKTAGMTAPDVGLAISNLSGKMGQFAGKGMVDEMMKAVFDGVMTKRVKRGQVKRWYWIKEVFGTAKDFKNSLMDAQGNFKSITGFLSDVEKGLVKKYGKFGNIAKKAALLSKVFGTVISGDAAKAMMEHTHTLEEDIFMVDKWGRFITKSGDLVGKQAAKVKLYSKGITFHGLKAVEVMTAQARMSGGEAKKFAEAMKDTSWGIRQLGKGIKSTFEQILGDHVLPIIDAAVLLVSKLRVAVMKFMETFPFLTKVIVVLGMVATGFIIVAAAGALVGGMVGMLGGQWSKMTDALGLVTKRMRVYSRALRIAAISQARLAGTQGLAGAATQASILSSRMFVVKNLALKFATVIGKVRLVFGHIVALTHSLMKKFWPILAVVLMIKGAVAIWRNDVFGIRSSLEDTGSALYKWFVEPFELAYYNVKRLFALFSLIGDLLSGDTISMGDVELLGKGETLKVIDFFRDGIGAMFLNISVDIQNITKNIKGLGTAVKAFGLLFLGVGMLIGGVIFGLKGALLGGAIGLGLGILIAVAIAIYKNWDKVGPFIGNIIREIVSRVKVGLRNITEWFGRLSWYFKVFAVYGAAVFSLLAAKAIWFGTIAVIKFIALKAAALAYFLYLRVQSLFTFAWMMVKMVAWAALTVLKIAFIIAAWVVYGIVFGLTVILPIAIAIIKFLFFAVLVVTSIAIMVAVLAIMGIAWVISMIVPLAIIIVKIFILAVVFVAAFAVMIVMAIAFGIAMMIAFWPVTLILLAIVVLAYAAYLIYDNWGGIADWFGEQFSAIGDWFTGLWGTIADGVMSGFDAFTDAIMEGLNWLADLLPGSDAKRGPLSNLTERGRSIPETLAKGMKKGTKDMANAWRKMNKKMPLRDTAKDIRRNTGQSARAMKESTVQIVRDTINSQIQINRAVASTPAARINRARGAGTFFDFLAINKEIDKFQLQAKAKGLKIPQIYGAGIQQGVPFALSPWQMMHLKMGRSMVQSDAEEGPFSHLTESGKMIPIMLGKGIRLGAPKMEEAFNNMLKSSIEDMIKKGSEIPRAIKKGVESETSGMSEAFDRIVKGFPTEEALQKAAPNVTLTAALNSFSEGNILGTVKGEYTLTIKATAPDGMSPQEYKQLLEEALKDMKWREDFGKDNFLIDTN